MYCTFSPPPVPPPTFPFILASEQVIFLLETFFYLQIFFDLRCIGLHFFLRVRF